MEIGITVLRKCVMGENRLENAKSLVVLLLAMIILTACMSSNNDKVLLQEESFKRKLTIELVQRYSGSMLRLNRRKGEYETQVRRVITTTLLLAHGV